MTSVNFSFSYVAALCSLQYVTKKKIEGSSTDYLSRILEILMRIVYCIELLLTAAFPGVCSEKNCVLIHDASTVQKSKK